MLVNAVYFKGQWVSQFDKGATAAAPFDAVDGATPQAAMMFNRLDQGRAEVREGWRRAWLGLPRGRRQHAAGTHTCICRKCSASNRPPAARLLPPLQYQVLTGSVDGADIPCPAIKLPYNGVPSRGM